jgi:hypothetical protein
MDNLVLSPVPLNDLLSQIRQIVKEELAAEQAVEIQEKLLSPKEACKVFKPAIGRMTLHNWTVEGKIKCTRMGRKVYYRLSDLLEGGLHLKKYGRGVD